MIFNQGENESPLHFEDLTIGYRKGRREVVVASGLSATLERGKLTCLLGRNGTGKSTLLRTLAGLQPPLKPQLSTVNSQPSVALVLTQRPDLRNLTAEEVVDLGRTPHTNFWGTLREDDRRIVAESLQLVGIETLANRPFETLSDGGQQKVMIAKALAQQTPMIFLDEPTAFLDFISRRELFTLLKRLAHDHGKAILLTTHDLALAEEFADTTWLLDDGERQISRPQK